MSNPGGNGIDDQIDNSIFADLTEIQDLQGSGRRRSNPPSLPLSEIAENPLFLDSEEPSRAESPKDTEVKNKSCGEDEASDGSVVQPPLNNISAEVEPPPLSSSINPEESNAMHVLVNDNANGNNNGGRESDKERFVIRKKLTKSDVGGNRRLTLGKELVKEHILAHLNETQKNQITSDGGLPVKFYDQDGRKEYAMTFRKPRSSCSYYFAGNWGEILRKRGLGRTNNVGLYWVDAEDASIPRSSSNVPHFCFSVL